MQATTSGDGGRAGLGDAEARAPPLSLVHGDPAYRLHRAVGLVPAGGLGVGRRAVFYALLTWLPIAAWAFMRGRLAGGAGDDPLLAHFGVHVRCLVAVPLLILAEKFLHDVTLRILPQFLRAQIVTDEAPYLRVVASVARLRDSAAPWAVIAGLAVAWCLLASFGPWPHEVVWAAEGNADGPLGFGGWWYLYVARPVYVTLVLACIWRLVLVTLLTSRLGRLDLSLVPTHPDRVGGLGFLAPLPAAFAPAVLAMSAVLAASWGHGVVYHDVALASLRLEAAAFLALILAALLAPLAMFAPVLVRTKRRALLDYAALVERHGRAVHARWIERTPAAHDADLLAAPEIGPVADTAAIYEAVARMRMAPITMASVLAVLVPAVIPMLLVVASKIPLKTLLLSLARALT
ncbi:MAG: hypothetical protein KJ018_07650 [Burkholderiales bacterium]|nr:hypothetical protein [Burkholderiales bacterium]GIK86967.1 MAG: hypothetical protein BroJett026_24480 [Betaproteobacteria bacterium]